MQQKIRRILGRTLEWVLIALMVGLTVIVIVAVFYRKLGASLSWYDEVASIMLAWITYYGAALAALKRRHIGFDTLLLMLPLPARMWATALAEALVLAFFAALAWAGFEVVQVLKGDTLVSLTWVSVQFTQSVIPIGAALFIVAELMSLPGYWRYVRQGISLDHVDAEED
ncbi:MAG: TRAP transporter small permease subunit [Hyphomicrobiales bacterium]|nr:TRAP transporter small permease subunit [Hyphomicrobiales bacterium]